MDQLNVTAWRGRSDQKKGRISEGQAAEFYAMHGAAHMPAPGDGSDMNPLWHGCSFDPTAPLPSALAPPTPDLGQHTEEILGDVARLSDAKTA